MEKSTRKAEDQGAPPSFNAMRGASLFAHCNFWLPRQIPMQLLSPSTVVARNQPRHGDAKMVNKDQVKGVAKQAKGAVKEAAGKITGNKKTEAEGKAEKAAGKVQKGYGDAKEKIKDAL
jgi:uncharacterized protein YjbJ (UPF0337 family)